MTASWARIGILQFALAALMGALASFGAAASSSTNLLLNSGFEGGPVSWNQTSTGGFSDIYTDGNFARTGVAYAWLGGYLSGTDTVSQVVAIPSTAQHANVQFWYFIATTETTTSVADDTMQVSITDVSSGATTVLASFSNLNMSSSWAQSASYDVSAYVGRTVRVTFSATNNSTNITNFFIDDIAVNASFGAGTVNPSIAAGFDRTCAVSRTGEALCWGDDDNGALGDGRFIGYTLPVQTAGLSAGVASVISSPSSYFTCALKSTGQALCWGNNQNGQLGNGTVLPSTIPAPVTGLTSGVTAIATGGYHACALTVSSGALCWGFNFYGQLGIGSTGNYWTPVPVTGLPSGLKAITAGSYHTCALSNAGAVLCWGQNVYGQLGNGTTTASSVPVPVSGLSAGVVAIAAGHFHTCALTSSGNVVCWGLNGNGQLGNGTTTNSAVPVSVAQLSGATQLAAGGYHNCAIAGSGAVRCWGWNGSGQLGNGSTVDSAVSVATPLAGVKALALGYEHSCAITSTSGVACWGANGIGQLGNGSQANSLVPVAPSGLPGPVSQIAAGAKYVCALSNGGLQCWGDNSEFQLGDGEAVGRSAPVEVSGFSSGIAAMGSGDIHSCALTQSGSVYCWGGGDSGQLGNGVFSAGSSLPGAAVSFPVGVTALAVGFKSNCVVTTAGGVMCWGENTYGGLGDGTTIDRSSPVAVLGMSSGVVQVGLGSDYACALTSTGKVSCWGYNLYGQLGIGTTTNQSAPASVGGLSSISAISVGAWHACALTSSSGVLCWGYNVNGQIGDATTVNRSAPVQVSGLASGVAAISAGWYHTCALNFAGEVLCWGLNDYGELGDGTTTSRSAPVKVSGLPSGVIAIAAGNYHTCALTNVGEVLCWGFNSSGGLGDSTFASRLYPVVVAHLGGTGSIAQNNWFLDLDPGYPKAFRPTDIPSFLANTTGNAAAAVVTVTANVQFPAQAIGQPIYVYGYFPASLFPGGALPKDSGNCVLGQVSASGTPTPTSASNIQAYVSNVTSSQGQAVSILNNTSASNVAGSTLCVGTGTNSAQAVGTSNSRCVASVPPGQSSQTCAPPAVVANVPDSLSGLWWNPNESGWGVNFTQRRNIVFAAWYTYDASGNPKWYVASNCTMPVAASSGTCTGALYEVSGPTFFAGAFNPSAVHVATAGSLQVNFANAATATMTYTVAGQTRTVAITRQPLSSGNTPPPVDYTDLWWNPNESGWGMTIAQQYNEIFVAWYVYDSAGKPVWYVAPNCAVNGSTCTGTLYGTTGPPFGPTFDSTSVHVLTAGTVTLTFSDPNNGTLTYTVNGVTATKAITRQLF
ncbi:MAG: hypothetical protein WA190_06390 [Usitatibacter sp.]